MKKRNRIQYKTALKSSAKYLVAALLIVLVLVWQSGMFKEKLPAGSLEDPRPAPGGAEEFVEVREMELPVRRTFVASVMPRETVELAAQTSGRVLEVDVAAGDGVKQGQVVMNIDPRLSKAQRAQAEAALGMAEADLEGARRLLAHVSDAAEAHAVPATEAIEAERVRDRAARAVEQRRANLDAAETLLGYTQITSPLDGKVIDVLRDPGDLVMPGQPVMLLYKPEELEVVTFVPADLAKNFAPGREVDIGLMPLDQTVIGRVRTGVDRVDPATRTLEVKLELKPPPSGALPGMYAEVRLRTGGKKCLAVPATAVGRLRGMRYVRVLTENDRMDRRLVRIGQEFNGHTEILAGLEAGARVLRVYDTSEGSGETP